MQKRKEAAAKKRRSSSSEEESSDAETQRSSSQEESGGGIEACEESSIEEVPKEAFSEKEKITQGGASAVHDAPTADIPVALEPASMDLSAPENAFVGGLEHQVDAQFHALMIEVAGLKLAIVAHEVDFILPIEDLVEHDEDPLWLMGLIYDDRTERPTHVLDSARWFYGDKFNALTAERLNYVYVVKLKNVAWGLTCDFYEEDELLQKSDIHWRQKVGKRPWMAGLSLHKSTPYYRRMF